MTRRAIAVATTTKVDREMGFEFDNEWMGDDFFQRQSLTRSLYKQLSNQIARICRDKGRKLYTGQNVRTRARKGRKQTEFMTTAREANKSIKAMINPLRYPFPFLGLIAYS